MRTEEVRGQEDGRFSPSTSGVSSSQEVEKNKRATKHKLVRADLRRSGELAISPLFLPVSPLYPR